MTANGTVVAAAVKEAVRLEDATKTYGRGRAAVHALRGVNVGFDRGSFTAVMGPSGSGKSTLLQCAAGLDRLTGGRVLLGGVDIGRSSESELTRVRRDRIGFVFQSFNLVPSLTAERNVELPIRLAGRRPGRHAVPDLLDRVGLAGKARRRPGELSGGERQRVAIARALITRPQVMFADEPTGALDLDTGRGVLALLREVAEVDGQTVVMVTHDPAAACYADRVVFLGDGQVLGDLTEPTPRSVAGWLAGRGVGA